MLYPDYYPPSAPQRWVHQQEGISAEVIDAYYERLVAHIAAVQEAGAKLGVPDYQLRRHDLSKFTAEEYAPYAKHFHGGGAPKEFARAWLNHLHKNPHHWQHWLFADNFNIKDGDVMNGALPMPEEYALEMIADWMGASVVYSGTEDMTDWLAKNIPKIILHPTTALYVREQLDKLGYGKVLQMRLFKSEFETAWKHDLADSLEKLQSTQRYRQMVEGEWEE